MLSVDLFFGLTPYGSNYLKTEPQLPAGIPTDVKALQAGVWIGADDESFVVRCSTVIERVYFDSIKSIDGKWSGSNATFTVTSPYRAALNASSHTDHWGPRISIQEGKENIESTPSLSVTEPLQVKEGIYHQWINTTAKMVVTYPVQVGSSGEYTDQQANRQHDLKLFVVSGEEFNAVAQHQWWTHTQSTNPVFLYLAEVFLWGIILIPLLLIEGAIAKRIKKRRNPPRW